MTTRSLENNCVLQSKVFLPWLRVDTLSCPYTRRAGPRTRGGTGGTWTLAAWRWRTTAATVAARWHAAPKIGPCSWRPGGTLAPHIVALRKPEHKLCSYYCILKRMTWERWLKRRIKFSNWGDVHNTICSIHLHCCFQKYTIYCISTLNIQDVVFKSRMMQIKKYVRVPSASFFHYSIALT